jgi:diguanylate cyclase (GGDEF)-like protein/PAS domain S-box-containing protein
MWQGLALFDASGRLVICNDRYRELYDLPAALAKPGTTIREILAYRATRGSHPGDPEAHAQELIAAAARGEAIKTFRETVDGRIVAVISHPVAGGGWVATHADVTDWQRKERELARATKQLIDRQYAIDQAVTFTMTDINGNITYINDKFTEISGYGRDELLGANHRVLNSGMHSAEFYQDMYATIESGQVWRGEMCNRAKDGSLYWVDTTIVPQRGEDGRPNGYTVIRIDITARKQAEAKIAYMANHDALTGLGNRAILNERLDAALARVQQRQESFAVLLLDLDGFKHVNDTLGHAAGDQLLKELARRLISALPEPDMVVRLGGDEFAVIQCGEDSQREAAIALALKLLDLVSMPVNLAGRDVTVGTSIGIALGPQDGKTAGDLLQNADLALYRAKSRGRNSFCFFDQTMSRDAAARLKMLNDLRAGLARDEFELHYQAVFDAKTRRPCGVEALVRWRHPVDGMVPPDRFIPLSEETGFIEPLGEWILEKACADAAAWPDHIKIAVNLSAMQFRSGKLFDVILCALVESGLPPERLELEITESVLMQDGGHNGVIIQQLKNIGVSIALDDFGTGYSSLVYLTKYPFDKIKIDKSFTQGLTDNAGCAASVASVLTLARALDMMVTAEGVETARQFELLRVAGVDQVQGFLFARPCPAQELKFDELERKVRSVVAA